VAQAGYSGTPLQQKLGLKPGWKVAVVGSAPTGLFDGFDGVTWRTQLRGPLDGVVLFVASRAELAAKGPKALAAIVPDGSVWIAWPKKASGVPTDMTEQAVRDLLVDERVVDNKVCAVDDVWSGLRLVYRRSAR
jgi:hypothetical protein